MIDHGRRLAEQTLYTGLYLRDFRFQRLFVKQVVRAQQALIVALASIFPH